jgi:L-asparaginase
MAGKSRLLLVATGGTISSASGGRRVHVPARGAVELLHGVPAIAELAEVTSRDVFLIPSRSITPAQMWELACAIERAADEGYHGAVITHGTDTLEETAYALALQIRRRIPVVLTGAMRPADALGTDGGANLLVAVQVAMVPASARLGPVVAIQDEIHLARWVTKSHTSRVAAFSSPGLGPVGSISEGRVRLQMLEAPTDYLGLPETLTGRVELIWVAAGSDGVLVDAAAAVANGIVVAGTGAGHVPAAMVPALQSALARGVRVILASRTGSGAMLERTYGGVGSETHLRELGVISAGDISPLKARLRLLVALSLGYDAKDVFPV